MSPTAIHLYCPHSLYFVFKMHSKSDNLGYLKDQNNVKFPNGFAPSTPTLDPLGRAQGTPPLPKSSSSKVLALLAVTYLSFFRTHALPVVACLKQLNMKQKKTKSRFLVCFLWYFSSSLLVVSLVYLEMF